MDVADMLEELDDYGFEDTETTRKVSILNKSIFDICSREPWPFLERVDTSPTVDAATGEVTISELAAVLSVVDTGTGQVLKPVRLDEFVQGRPLALAESGNPYLYYFVGETMYIWPIPSSANLQVNYVKTPTTVDDTTVEADIDIPARYHELIVVGALFRLYLMEDDAELAAGFKAQFDEKLLLMRQDAFKKQYDRPDRIFVMEDEYDEDWLI